MSVKIAWIGQSAGNQRSLNESVGSSETTRKNVQLHFSKHTYPNNDEAFGYYLAGLIDGDGWISDLNTQNKIVIAFHSKDVKTVHFLRQRIGFGSIKKHDTSITYVITGIGVVKVCELINGKLQIERKKIRLLHLLKQFGIVLRTYNNVLSTSNHYLAGLVDADGCLGIHTLYKENLVKLQFRFELKAEDLILVKGVRSLFGGGLYFRQQTSSWRYECVSFKNLRKALDYFEKYQLISKYAEYCYLCKALWLVEQNLHLTPQGRAKIQHYREKMDELKK